LPKRRYRGKRKNAPALWTFSGKGKTSEGKTQGRRAPRRVLESGGLLLGAPRKRKKKKGVTWDEIAVCGRRASKKKGSGESRDRRARGKKRLSPHTEGDRSYPSVEYRGVLAKRKKKGSHTPEQRSDEPRRTE